MITKKHALHVLIVLSMSILASCQKDFDQNLTEMDQSRIRGLNAKLNDKAVLGRMIYFDSRFSEPSGLQSCSSCHLPHQGFVGKGNVPSTVNAPGFTAGIAQGAVFGAFGGRKPPSAAYATFAPAFSFDVINGEFFGGLFWDGRADGSVTGTPAGDQALGPFLNNLEQNHPTKESVLAKIINDQKYQQAWQKAFGELCKSNSLAETEANYKKVGIAIAEYEASAEVNQFTSKFDFFLRGQAQLSALEQQGMDLFVQAECDNCHVMEPQVNNLYPLFTDFSYDNIGVPSNVEFLAIMGRNRGANLDGGLGARLATSTNPNWSAAAPDFLGAFKTPTLRNVAKGEENKRFMHNGVFKTLKEVVHFYNTRDVTGAGWNEPEFPATMNTRRVGRLGLSSEEEDAIVAFMRTLSDGWKPGTQNTQGVL